MAKQGSKRGNGEEGQPGGPEEASEKRKEWVPWVLSMSVGPWEDGEEKGKGPSTRRISASRDLEGRRLTTPLGSRSSKLTHKPQRQNEVGNPNVSG